MIGGNSGVLWNSQGRMVAPVEVSHSLVLALCRWHDCGKRKVPSKKNSAKAATLCCCNISKHWISQEKKGDQTRDFLTIGSRKIMTYSAPACISERTMNSRGPLDDGFARTACFPTWERSPWISMRCALHKRSFLPKIRLRNHQAAQAATVRIFPGCSIFYLFFLAFSRTLPPMNFSTPPVWRAPSPCRRTCDPCSASDRKALDRGAWDIYGYLGSTQINWDQLGSTGDGSGQIIIIH